MEYNFTDIEREVKELWAKEDVFHTEIDHGRPKYYVLDMFPYPSGTGLHVGHPLGYVASDIIARFKRLKGYNVLHPMGYDSFGLPAEQYAIQTGQHPSVTTEKNTKTFREQMEKLGFSFEWRRELRTSDPGFYKWTQWIFIKLFHSWYNRKNDCAEAIDSLIARFEKNGSKEFDEQQLHPEFTPQQWQRFSEKEKSEILFNYRLAYIADSWVNWCPALGTVLANDEVKEGVSERGGYPVERKLMKQWSLRITVYADRLLESLNSLDWSESIKEAQRNWIGRSEGCSISFTVVPEKSAGISTAENGLAIEVFTTRPDTIFGTSFITLAPEHELAGQISTSEYKEAVNEYLIYAKNKSERDRMADVKKITGQFTGAYVIHPFSRKQIPVWIGEYVLGTYGTGAVMGVPGHDARDHAFAKHFGLPITHVIAEPKELALQKEDSYYEGKDGFCVNSFFLNGLPVRDAIKKAIVEIEKDGLGKRKINYRMRDAIFGRQRYWGEPIPVYYDEEGIPHTIDENDLPLVLPEVDKYLPTDSGEPPLARAESWKYKGEYDYELTTMPGWAGSSWYYLRYEDPENGKAFASKEAIDYWKNIDFYLGGDEHATGHLLYFRFWTKFLYDRGWIPFDEPAKKLLNQGKIQGVSAYIYRLKIGILYERDNTSYQSENLEMSLPFLFISADLFKKAQEEINAENTGAEILKGNPNAIQTNPEYDIRSNPLLLKEKIPAIQNFINTWEEKFRKQYADFDSEIIPIHLASIPISIKLVNSSEVEISELKKSHNDFLFGEFILNERGEFFSDRVVEKMSKSKYNVVNPDEVVAEYGADTFRMYEMFLGPIEQSKPWDTKGIDGVYRFLKKLWRLFYDDNGNWIVTTESATHNESKVLHRTIKKTEEDIERLSFNTTVSAFMICVNDLTQMKSHKVEILQPLLVIISPYAPFITDYLWRKLDNETSIIHASFPKYDPSLLQEETFEYPVAINGKTRAKLNLALDLSQDQVEKEVMNCEPLQKYFDGRTPKKVIVVKGRMINVVV